MAGYTLLNLAEVEDAAPRFGMAPAMEARFARSELDADTLGLSLQRLAPDARQPFGHRHREQEEVYVVLDGSGRAKVDDEVIELRRHDALRVAPGTMRCFEAGPDGLEYVAFGAHPEGGDVEMEPGWWAE